MLLYFCISIDEDGENIVKYNRQDNKQDNKQVD